MTKALQWQTQEFWKGGGDVGGRVGFIIWFMQMNKEGVWGHAPLEKKKKLEHPAMSCNLSK